MKGRVSTRLSRSQMPARGSAPGRLRKPKPDLLRSDIGATLPLALGIGEGLLTSLKLIVPPLLAASSDLTQEFQHRLV